MKNSLKIIIGALFVFALVFNTTVTNNKGEVSLSLTSLQMAQAQDGEDDFPPGDLCLEVHCYTVATTCYLDSDGNPSGCDEELVCDTYEVPC